MTRDARVSSILYLTSFFPPDPIAKRSGGIARALAERGHRVTVITKSPTALTGVPLKPEELTSADRRLPASVDVLRLSGGVEERGTRSFVGRLSAQLRFAAQAGREAMSRVRDHDVVLVYSPPPALAAMGRVVSGLGGRPLVLEVQDLYPDQAVALGFVRDGPVARAARAVESDSYRNARRLIVPTDGFREHVVRCGAPPDRVRVIPNSCDLRRFHPGATPLETGTPARPFNVVFAGTLGLAQGLETVLEAARILRERTEIGFELFGDGARRQEIEACARADGLANVYFGGGVPQELMPSVMARGDVLLLTLHHAEVFDRVVPSKLAEYLAMGRPVVAAAGRAVAGILAHGAGVTVPPMNGRGLAAALLSLETDRQRCAAMGALARDTAVQRFGDEPVLKSCVDAIIEAA